jgi:hypothetical protein
MSQRAGTRTEASLSKNKWRPDRLSRLVAK